MRYILLVTAGVLTLYCCTGSRSGDAQKIIDQAIVAHGGKHFMNAEVSFNFRDMAYSARRTDSKYVYTRSFIQEEDTVKDVLVNSSKFTRFRNGDAVDLPDTMKTKYSNSVNSVLYFIQLPYLLNDPAVNKKYQGQVKIKGEKYDVVKVTFDTEGGGKDFEDEYMYWINRQTRKLDYLAYNYQTDGGGVRFREAYNRVERGGILFQDYVNFEAPIGTPLHKLPRLYEKGSLKELSRIENDRISVHKTFK